MKNIKLTLLLLCIIAFFSCNDDEDPILEGCGSEPLQYTLINYITGMDFYDANGASIGRWGFPNHKQGDALIYPIPSTGVVSISSQNKIKRIWLAPAACVKDSVTQNITMLSQDLNFSVSEIESIQVKDIPTPDFNNNINLNWIDVPTGMYRVFYQMESDEIFWYNFYISTGSGNIPDFSFMDNWCN